MANGQAQRRSWAGVSPAERADERRRELMAAGVRLLGQRGPAAFRELLRANTATGSERVGYAAADFAFSSAAFLAAATSAL